MSAADLRATTLAWARQFWDPERHMVWNPPGSFDSATPPRSVHLTPNTAWVAYGLLGSDDPADRAEAAAAVDVLIGIQYDEPGAAFHGTYARVLEAPHPPDPPTMWVDYDPNWRQFVGTTFALMLEDHAEALGDERCERVLASIALASEGEPDGRIDVNYANPALMRAWLDAWLGARMGDAALVERGEAFARAVLAAHDTHGAFDEFNSPTYYGIDLYALRIWQVFPPTPYFAAEGERVERELRAMAMRFYNPALRNFCGPYTRSYHPDATRSVALFALWIWAAAGREAAPLPALDAPSIDHGHDLMAGPVVARLAPSAGDAERATVTQFEGTRDIAMALANDRAVTAHVERDLMVGAESSPHDWRGWSQFMPFTAHWAEGATTGVLWLLAPRRLRATVRGRGADLTPSHWPIELRVLASECSATAHGFATDALSVAVTGAVARVEPTGASDYRVVLELTEDEPGDPVGHERGLVLTFDLHGDRAGDVDGVALQLD